MPQAVTEADDAQVVILRDALKAPPVRTSAPASVFSIGAPAVQRAAQRQHVGAPDPASLAVVSGPPTGKMRRGPPSAWQAVWDALQPGGDGRAMTPEQAVSFAAWARQHGHSGKLTRCKIDGATTHVWRKA